ncbi:sensor histidine kinase [Streptomyces sp. NPDC092046]|uniref:sensor histidine kinase n=1 Tax=Streptomyces sp. NPDC092046 TaxID=3366009 RepID=UPI0038103E05
MTTDLSGALQRSTSWVRAFDAARPRVWDTLLTLFWTGAALVDASGGWRNTAADPTLPAGLVAGLTLVSTLPLFWRRRHPAAVLTVLACAALVGQASGAFLQVAYLQAIPLFLIALTRPARTLLRSAALLVPPLVVGALRFAGGGSWDQHVVPTLLAYALVALLGLTVRSRRDARDREVRLAAATERARIAREMHDIIGHSLTVITGLADGGRYAAAKRPDRAAQALDAIGTTSREALADLRRLLGVLREDGTPEPVRDPQPTLADLEPLIAGVREAGLPVVADLPPAPRSLSPGAQLTVYRVVQEALTNTLKHAGEGAEATVELTYAPDALVATVTDTGTEKGRVPTPTPTPSPSPSPSPNPNTGTTGRGLTGMRERAALYDGTLECGPPPTGGGWRVRLRIPREGSPS